MKVSNNRSVKPSGRRDVGTASIIFCTQILQLLQRVLLLSVWKHFGFKKWGRRKDVGRKTFKENYMQTRTAGKGSQFNCLINAVFISVFSVFFNVTINVVPQFNIPEYRATIARFNTRVLNCVRLVLLYSYTVILFFVTSVHNKGRIYCFAKIIPEISQILSNLLQRNVLFGSKCASVLCFYVFLLAWSRVWLALIAQHSETHTFTDAVRLFASFWLLVESATRLHKHGANKKSKRSWGINRQC